jgi:hypothetical protein
MKITLDRQAILALFEKDPEFKVKFQAAAINYAAKHFIKSALDNVAVSELQKQVDAVVKKEVGEFLRGRWSTSDGKFTPSEKFKKSS